MKKTVACLTAFLSLVSFVAWSDAKSDLAEGIRYHDLSRVNPAGNLNKGKNLLGPLKDKDPVARGYYGSLLTLEADAQNKQKKVMKAMELLEEGTTLMDEAVERSPNTEDLRFLRMINSYELSASSPLNRYKVMKEDIDWLDANRSSLESSGKGTLDLYKGLYFMKARKPDEGIAAFKSCIAVSPGSDEAKEAAKQLARYE
jgi:tetratricopeptide (TPR) repeat protein